jgi:heme A synthase
LNKIFVLTIISLILVFSTMISGRSITASRQGISCTEWPLCPNGFSLPPAKFLNENIHRLLAILSAILVSIITIILRNDQSKHTRISYLALIFILFEIFIGMFVVFTKLQSVVVAIHLSNGVIVFALTILLLVSYREVIRKHS